MLISARDVSPEYKAREKEETLRMEAVLKDAIDASTSETFKTTLLTRPANPLRSKAAWFTYLAYLESAGVTDDGVSIHVTNDDAFELDDIADIIWESDCDASLILFACSDGSVVAGKSNPQKDGVLLLPLALQLRGTLKDAAGTSIKQVYRTGDGWIKPKGVFLTPKDAATTNILMLNNPDTILFDQWSSQLEIEINALFDYQAKYPLRIDHSIQFEGVELSMGLGMSVDISDRELALICRPKIYDCHLHMGMRSFSDQQQELLAEALEAAVHGLIPDSARPALDGHNIVLLAGCPYNNSEPHLETSAENIGSVMKGYSKADRDALLEPIQKALKPILEKLRPTAMFQHREDIKATWTIASARPSPKNPHQKVDALRTLAKITEKILG
jgi:hypothetical protein